MNTVRTYRRPRTKDIQDVKLPSGFSETFVSELLEVLPLADSSFKAQYLRKNILSKYCDPKTTKPSVRKSAAIEKWLACERRNLATNQRLFLADQDFGWTTWSKFVLRTRRVISKILGPVLYPDVILTSCHTNGSSTRVGRSSNAALLKLEGTAHMSSSALKHWLRYAGNTRLVNQNLELAESSVLFTVPKKSDIDRVACKEPEINMLLQRSVGSFIRRRLSFVGVDLNDQTVNQKLAASAVRDGLATIDLSSASDSISRQLVFALLPFEWYSLLDDLRVKTTLVDGQIHDLEMFSSMGNGFTFELESLLFYAITRAICGISKVEGRISVYGDDIIAPNSVVPRLIRMFHFIGFKTNTEKTFWTGAFRESCGKHYYGGFDVSPFFIRRKVSTLPDLINILNRLCEWDGRGWGFIIDANILSFHRKYATFVPPYFWGSDTPDDPGALLTGHAPRYRLTPKTRRVDFNSDLGYSHWLMAKGSSDVLIAVEPTKEFAYKATRASSGWRTDWKPWINIQE